MKNENLLQFSSFSTAIIYQSKDTKPHKVERTKFLYFFYHEKKILEEITAKISTDKKNIWEGKNKKI